MTVDLESFSEDFYRLINPDLAHLSYTELSQHYLSQIDRSSLFTNENQLINYWLDNGFPDDFNYFNYLFLNPDLPFTNKYQCLIHYINFGKSELREFKIGSFFLSQLHANLFNKFYSQEALTGNIEIENIVASRYKLDNIPKEVESLNPRNFVIDFLDIYFDEIPSPSKINAIIKLCHVRKLNYTDLRSCLFSITVENQLLEMYRHSERESSSKTDETFEIMGTHEPKNLAFYLNKFSSNNNFQKRLFIGICSMRWKINSVINRIFVKLRHRTKVSLICSVYDGDFFIEDYLKNISGLKGFHLCELIFIDANSPGNEFETIKLFQKKFSNIKYFRIQNRIGIYEAWNYAARQAEGKYLTSVNLDDRRFSKSIKKYASALDRHSDIDVVYGNMHYALVPNFAVCQTKKINLVTSFPEITSHNLFEYNSPNCAPMWRKSLHSQIGYFDESMKVASDLEFWLRCASHEKKFGLIEESLTSYYLNPDGLSTSVSTLASQEALEVMRTYKYMLADNEILLSKTI